MVRIFGSLRVQQSLRLGSRRRSQRAIATTLVRVSDDSVEPTFNEADEIAYIRTTPVETILGNHLFVLIQVAALRLSETPPNLEAAELVIDTVAAMVNAAGERLGEHVDLYRNALAEVQQAYVRAKSAPLS